MKPGIFITLEGGDGSGKTTQARLLASALKRQGRRVVHTREPGGTAAAEAVRRVLLQPAARLAPLAELLLYEAARAQHVTEVIRPALATGAVVLCERYTDATLAYQGYGRGIPLADIRRLNRLATAGLAPHLTVLIDVPVRKGLGAARRARGGDRIERAGATFHTRVRRGYLALARREPGRFSVIPQRPTAAATHGEIWSEVQKWLN